MATQFPIWALHMEPSGKNVPVEFSSINFFGLSQIPIPEYHIGLHTAGYDHVVVCVHVRCVRHVKGAVGCGAWLWRLRSGYMPSSLVRTGRAAAAGNAH